MNPVRNLKENRKIYRESQVLLNKVKIKDNGISNGVNLTNSINFQDLKAPLFIAWQINAECNLGCLHCCEEAGGSMPDEMNKEEIFRFLQQVVDLNIPYVALSGGEPLLHSCFFEICEFIRKHNISLKVETNGEFINEERAKKIAQLRFRSVQVSLDGATASTHERLRLRGNWNKAISACQLLIREGVNTEIVFVPTKFNIHEITNLIDLAYSLGVLGVYTGKIMRIGRAAQNWDILCPSDQEYKDFFATLNDRVTHYDGKMKVYYYPYDVIEELKYRLKYPSASVLVLPNGKVKLIGPLPFICGDLKKESLAKIWENYKRAWRKPKVVAFAKKVIAEPKLLAESNKWRGV
ncbi:MAG: radical SAM protein [Candidatus Omnitrophota bacterium]|nr:radical SAM protein [Candidatus Omnitrophota bacterium]